MTGRSDSADGADRAASVLTLDRVDWINVLRVLACAFVFQAHTILSVTEYDWKHMLVLGGVDLTWLLLPPPWAGVWIFFALSGYLIGKGYFSGRYVHGLRGSLRFYWNRFIRLAPPYFLAVVVIYAVTGGPAVAAENLKYLIPVVTFTYKGNMPYNPVGWLWFVSTLMGLYLLTPVVWALIRRWSDRRSVLFTALAATVVAGLALRCLPLLMWPDRNAGLYWYETVYVPVWMNLDIFFGAFIAAGLIRPRSTSLVRSRVDLAVAVTAFAAFALSGAWLAMNGTQWGTNAWSFLVLMFVYPTATLLVVILWLHALDTGRRQPIGLTAISRNPARMIELAAPLTYGIFIWHSAFLTWLGPYLISDGPWSTYLFRAQTTVLLASATAAVIYFTVERPTARLRWATSPRSRDRRATGVTVAGAEAVCLMIGPEGPPSHNPSR